MATDSGVDIDLYAGVDDLENEISGQEALSGTVDLYEDVLTTGGEVDPEQEVLQAQEEYTETPEVHQPTQAPVPGSTYEYKSYTTVHPKSTQVQSQSHFERTKGRPLYVGNMTWWTTDQELTDALQECGVTDLVNIKFFDNRTNGQSKGYAMIELGSETSIRLVGERLPKMELHGQHPQVTPATKQHLHEFEAQSRKNNPSSSHDRGPPGQEGRDYQPGGRGGFNHHAGFRGRGGMPPHGRGFDYGAHGGHMQGPRMPPPGMMPYGQPPRGFHHPPAMHGMPPPPPGEVPLPPMSAPMQMPPPPPGVMNMQDQRMWGERPAMVPPMIKPPVAPHVNPAFFPEGPTPDSFLAASGMGRMDMLSQFQPRPGDDYADSMKRNQTLGSSAIKRAMSDANAGDYESGIETLVGAISLIKQSPSAQEERCQVLVQSLQDCLQGLEAQLLERKTSRKESRYDDKEDRDSERKHRRRRSRSRSRSRERSSRRSGSRERRSRSRERHRRR